VRACPACGYDDWSWVAIVDVNAPGAPRKQRSKACKTRTEAVAWAASIQSGKQEGTWVEPDRKRTVSSYLTSWLTARKSTLKPNTHRGYEVAIRHITTRIGHIVLQGLTKPDVRALYAALAESGLGEKTIHNIHIVLCKALDDAAEDGLVTRNVANHVHKGASRPEMKAWSEDELATFLAFTREDADYTLYHLVAYTGLRRGEVLGLRWRDIDLNHAQLTVREQWTRQGGPLGTSQPKSDASRRQVTLDAATVEVLRAVRPPLAHPTALVFARADGSHEDPNVIGRRFVRRARACGITEIPFHGLRHTHATILQARHVDAKTVSQRLGHSDVSTTLRIYTHPNAESHTNAANVFGSAMKAAFGG
jgi:integrase